MEKMKLKELLEAGTSYLQEHHIPDSKIDAWLLMEYVFDIGRTDYLMEPSKDADETKAKAYMLFIEKRGSHYPLQYITGHQEFMELDFLVDESVLIPRQDTEVLVETVLAYMEDGNHILDMCTGSGCIIISLAAEKQAGRAVGTDVSEAALRMARSNAEINHVGDVELIRSDLFENVDGCYDIIVSNPPYIPSGSIIDLMPEVKSYEPLSALDGTADGLYFYRRIIKDAKIFLKPGGHLFFEIGWNQGEEIREMLRENGFSEIVIKKDLAGLDRVVYASLPNRAETFTKNE